MAIINPFSRNKQKLKKNEIESALSKIRAEYDKYIVTYHKPATLKEAFERRYKNAQIESMDMTRFLSEEIAAVQSIFTHQDKMDKERKAETEQVRLKEMRKGQPDFADRVLEKLKNKMLAYPSLNFHKEASYEITHLYGAMREFEKCHWPPLDRFIRDNGSWALRGEKKDFNTELWRFVPSGDGSVPLILERYFLMLNATDVPLKEISIEAQQCIKQAAFLLNDIIWSCNQIIRKGIDGSNIEKNLKFVQNIIDDFRIKDLKDR